VQVNARKEEDIDDSQIRQRLITAVGSNYEAGAVKQVDLTLSALILSKKKLRLRHQMQPII
jgi:hypothetical protein